MNCRSTGCRFSRHVNLSESLCRSAFYRYGANPLESRCFRDRDGEKPAAARHSSATERCAVRRICLASSHAWAPWTDAQIALAQDLQLHPEDALSGLPIRTRTSPFLQAEFSNSCV